MKKSLASAIILVFVISNLNSQKLTKANEEELILKSRIPVNLSAAVNYFDYHATGEKRSVTKSVVFSGIIPGGGQFYNRSFMKGAVFTGVEVLSWVLYFNFRNTGNDIDREFKAFADEHWKEEVYRNWTDAYIAANGSLPHNFTHTLPETKTQQYYEMIGKYEQFLIGWDDVTNYEQTSEKRVYYMDRRGESNDYLVKASYIAMFTLLNRIVSIVDAAIISKNYNVKIESSVSFGVKNNRTFPEYSLNLMW